MAKKKSWFNRLKRLFISETSSNPEKKEKRRRWALGRLKIKRLASLSAPSPPRGKTLSEAEEEQSKHAVNVAIATAAAADAAVAAAQVAAELVMLFGAPQSTHPYEETQQLSAINSQTYARQSAHQCEREIQDLAATIIQTAYRGYLARKALRALKGLVRLQAIIRGRAVRRQAVGTLRCLQSIVNIQSQVCARRCQRVEGNNLHCEENKESQDMREKDIKIDSNSQTRWDDSILSKEESNALFLSKREALIKRERIKEYSLSQRESKYFQRPTEPKQNKVNGRWKYWLEQWVDSQLAKQEDLQNLDTVCSSNERIREDFGGRQLKLRNSQKQYYLEGSDSPLYVPRRSFHHRRQRSTGEDNSFAGSPVLPTYMAATESAKAKARSMSSPRLRTINADAYSEMNSPYKHKLSPISSINSEAMNSSRIGHPGGGFSQRSPCLKGLPGPVKSNRTLRDLSFDSECSVPNWDQYGAFR